MRGTKTHPPAQFCSRAVGVYLYGQQEPQFWLQIWVICFSVIFYSLILGENIVIKLCLGSLSPPWSRFIGQMSFMFATTGTSDMLVFLEWFILIGLLETTQRTDVCPPFPQLSSPKMLKNPHVESVKCEL